MKKSKVIIDGKSEDVSFLFIKLWHKKASQSDTWNTYILSYLAQRILVTNGYIIAVGDYIKQSGNYYCKKNEES